MSEALDGPNVDDPSALSTAELWRCVVRGGHAVPRPVIEECARRGDEILDEIERVLQHDYYWEDDTGEGESWLPLHGPMVLGLMENERAAELLLGFMRRADQNEDLYEWLAGFWPFFFRNKPTAAIESARALVADTALDPGTRAEAVDCALACAEAHGEAALQPILDWAAELAFSGQSNPAFAALVGETLLTFARPEYRAPLEKLADRQPRGRELITRSEIRDGYLAKSSGRTLEHADAPWHFYEPEQIEERERQFEAEAEIEPFVRETPKVGRNDPCPCGSGKKYKKCCLSQHEQ